MTGKPTARIYVDGFNLYRRALDEKPHLKWLDLRAAAQAIMPDHEVTFVRYFTANVRPGMSVDVQAPVRQQTYLRALETDPLVSIHHGSFRNDNRWMDAVPLTVDPVSGRFVRVKVRKVEEKGSDVHLAARMIADAHQSLADIYVLLSNDSDQVPPLEILRELGYDFGIIFPMPSARSSKELVKTNPAFIGHVTDAVLAASQFPAQLADSRGRVFHRPAAWV
ncbi:NYN domain-containing protein [Rathayibacter sp. VKM Ac-2929]|uniref:NYN domain-containing protein n=1 Tax=Rathayibacter sp. VKM Ac-2929 TaxID=2929480 RepID=UPI001FB4EE85|nr:NYN domain-containing protein [Rathayibacter sp. VKM Ac-2929]MCJ1675663.1 NYN domain-containing protein [Rathayibacter sp. VKM Ac-2929]